MYKKNKSHRQERNEESTKRQEGAKMYFDLLTKRKQQLMEQKMNLRQRLEEMPPGNLYCVKNGKYYRWDLYMNTHQKEVIPKKNLTFAEEMALKGYYLSQYKDIKKEEKAIKAYLKNYQRGHAVEKLLKNPEYYRLLAPHLSPADQDMADWAQQSYEKNEQHPENLLHEVMPHIYVRSKSEALIYTILYKNKIPFHYEEKLQLGNHIIYPDFTLRHPKTGNIYYWEHFGMWDEAGYCKKACSKMQLYAEHGIIPSVQLITTYETMNYPLTVAKIEKIVEDFFL